MKIATTEVESRAVIVGAGSIGIELARRIAAQWRTSIVDTDEERLRGLSDLVETKRVRAVQGDGTSRLVLERAGADKAEQIIAATGSDEMNLEICRVAKEHFPKARLHAAMVEPRSGDDYRALGVEIAFAPVAAAIELESRVLRGSSTYLRTAEARGELVETAVLQSSKAIGRPLSSLRSQRWHVAAIYRKGELIVPTGRTTIEADDRVLLTGEPGVLKSIAEFFRIGQPEFPMEFGSNVLVLVESAAYFGSIAGELNYFYKHIRARQLEVLYWPHEGGIRDVLDRQFQEHQLEAVTSAVFGSYSEVASKNILPKDCGTLILPDEQFRFLERLGLKRTALSGMLRQVNAPIMFLRGSHPYRKIMIPVTDSEESMRSARVAFDLAQMFGAEVTAVTVTPPKFIVGESATDEQRAALKKVTDLAGLYRMQIRQVHLEGNPINELLRIAPEYQMVIITHRRGRKPSFFDPDVSQHLLRRIPVTTIALSF